MKFNLRTLLIVAILGPALLLLLRPSADGIGPFCDHGLNGRPPVWKSGRFSALLTPGVVLFALWPFIQNALPIVRGGMLMLENATLRQSFVQILTSTGFAVGASVMSMGIALRICAAFQSSPGAIASRIFWMSLLLPGLLGSLVLSLGLLAMFQLPGLRGLYDTWLPMLLGQTLAVLPFASAVVLLLMRVTDPAALHSAS